MGKAFLYKQILLTNASRKCMEISLESNLALGSQETRTLYTSYH